MDKVEIFFFSFLYLEHSQSDYVLFQAASTIKETIIREWLVLPSEEKESLKNYIVQYLAARPQ